MKKIFLGLTVCLFWLISAEAQELYPAERLGRGRLVFEKSRHAIELEVAMTETARARGLMFREALAENTGMLFIHPKEDVLGVWMKNTKIPLDILFISPQGKIVSILQNVQPCITTACGVYDSRVKALFMLEVNAGTVERLKIMQGDRVLIELEE
ncbi:DUF192 domain-containing protein [Methylotuvimicrobium buryatense]|nr:DUF192 domain-containing protein [Methylotuvimicrobium buryatense]